MARRAVHYSSLTRIVGKYGFGWYRRLFDTHRAALALTQNSKET